MGVFLAVLAVALVAYLWWNRSALYLAAAHRAFQRHDLPATLRAFAKAERAGRLGADPTASYAYLLLKQDEVDEAEVLVDRALREGRKGRPVNERDRRLLESTRSLVLWKRGHRDQAVEILEDVLASGYRTTSLYGSLGYFLIALERWDRAEAVCQEALDWDSEGRVILDNWGAYLLARQRVSEAEQVYTRLLDREPRFPEAWFNAGLAAERAGQREEARRRYEHALELPFHGLTTVSPSEVEEALARVQDSSSAHRE